MDWLRARSGWTNVAALLSYGVLAVVFHWPLAAHLGTTLTGPPASDTGTYVWNLWVFRHEIVAHGRFPLFTNEILALTPPIDLSLHNYTLFSDLLAYPLIPYLGVVTTFNVLYLGICALTAWTMFLLCRRVTRRIPEAWVGGLLFGFSPVLVARSTAHFSLAAAAPLPLFVLCLLRFEQERSVRNGIALGATIAWATICDPYFGIYCLLIGACYLAARWCHLESTPVIVPARRRSGRPLAVLVVADVLLIGFIIATGGTDVHVGRIVVGLRTLYTPVFLLTVLAVAWTATRRDWRASWRGPQQVMPVARALLVVGCTTALLLSPLFYALEFRFADGGVVHHPFFWRSSPRGVDLLAFFTPNPNSRWFGSPFRAWLESLNGGLVENAAALSLVGLAILIVCVWRYRFRPPREWVALFVFFAALSLGPFVEVGGRNTYIPGPWALLRYVPIVSATRVPTRFAIVATMAFTLLCALAFTHVRDRFPRVRALTLTGVTLLFVFELAPFPRQLYSAHVPDIYRLIADDARDVTVLELPFGFSDGERGEGAFDPEDLFFQIVHQKPIIGGALSRLSDREFKRQHSVPMVPILLRLSEGKDVAPPLLDRAARTAASFVAKARLGYVVINRRTTPPELVRFAVDAFALRKISASDDLDLYVPTVVSRPHGRKNAAFGCGD